MSSLMLQIRAFNQLKAINDKVNEDSSKAIFQLKKATTLVPEYLYISYINIQTKQQRGESTLNYLSGLKDQEG